ncbi:hypothetical protein [Motiliproteus sp. SC1-56]|uniref:hypothetical protein n=1 Tax=Motiliproteus sp. SC1-56 TaxID=2799565 RepID=UPI001A8CCD14|nr:hypothetical protein [Motiliproteus sp. SC1-56]
MNRRCISTHSKVFFDDNPLVDQVNRNHRIKIEFEITETQVTPPGLPTPAFFTVQDGIDPDTAVPGSKRIKVNRDKLFKAVLTAVNSHEYTLREIVLFEANVMGGVHAGSPKSDKEKALKQINDTISVGGYASSLRQLKAVGRVILKGLEPLKQRIIGAIDA